MLSPKLKLTTYQAGLIQAKAYRSLNLFLGGFLDQYGLTMSDWGMLGLVYDSNKQTSTELANRLSVELPRISVMVKKLIEMQLLTKTASTTDSRVSIISITEQGKNQVKEIEKLLRVEMRQFLKGISITRLYNYIKVLEQIAGRLEEA